MFHRGPQGSSTQDALNSEENRRVRIQLHHLQPSWPWESYLLTFLSYNFLCCKYRLPYRDFMWIESDSVCVESGTQRTPTNSPSRPRGSAWEATGRCFSEPSRLRGGCAGQADLRLDRVAFGARPWKLG